MAPDGERKKSGQGDLLRKVLEENHPAVRRFLRYLTRGMYPAEDLAQEVVLRALNAGNVPGTELGDRRSEKSQTVAEQRDPRIGFRRCGRDGPFPSGRTQGPERGLAERDGKHPRRCSG